MGGMRKAAGAALAALVLAGLTGCPSTLLSRINEEIADAPFTGTEYAFVSQWGNSAPQYSFYRPIVKTDSAGFVYVADSSYRVRKFSATGELQSTVSGMSTRGVGARIYDMAFDTTGNMYVTTNDTHKVQKYDKDGNLLAEWAESTDVYNGTALTSGRGIAVDTNGVYVVDMYNDRVVKFNSAGTYVAEWGGVAVYGTLPLSSPDGIAVDSLGKIYVVDSGNHRIVRLKSDGTYETDWGNADVYPPITGTLMSDPSRAAIYSTTHIYVSDTGNDRIIQFSLMGAYQQTWGDSAQFANPESLAVDTAGAVYVAEGSSMIDGRIKKFDVSSTPTLTTTWTGGAGAEEGTVAAPWGVVFDSSGNVIVSETGNARLEKFDSTGAFLAAWGSAGTGAGQYALPTGIAISGTDTIYVTDFGNRRYQVLDSAGNPVTTVGSSGTGNGFFGGPVGAALDADGNVYVSDGGNTLVQVFSTDGYFLRQWGSVGTGDGQFLSGGNYGIAVDKNGYVYVSDYWAHRVQKFDLQGTYVSTIGSFGTGDGQFNSPMGMAVDPVGNLYVCDMMNHRVQKFDSSGAFMAKFGGPGAGDGGFGWPVSVAVNSSGRVVVTDYTGSLVQVFEPTF